MPFCIFVSLCSPTCTPYSPTCTSLSSRFSLSSYLCLSALLYPSVLLPVPCSPTCILFSYLFHLKCHFPLFFSFPFFFLSSAMHPSYVTVWRILLVSFPYSYLIFLSGKSIHTITSIVSFVTCSQSFLIESGLFIHKE